MKTLLSYGLMGVALIASANGIVPFEAENEEVAKKLDAVISVSKEKALGEDYKIDEHALDEVMSERMKQICSVLHVDSTSLTKEQMATLLNQVEEF